MSPRRIREPRAIPVDALLSAARSTSGKDFTQTLRAFEKENPFYPGLRKEDAVRLFHGCRSLAEHSDKKVVRFNALRLLKFAVTTDDLLREHAEDVWALFRKVIFDPDGDVRNAGLHLFSRYHFGLSCIADPWELRKRKKSQKAQDEIDRFQKMLVEQFLALCALEKTYAKDHADEEELWRKSWGRITPFWETKDKILKTIRRALEECNRGIQLEELAEKHGYSLPNHWVLDSFLLDDDKEMYAADGDREAATFSADGTAPVYISEPPKPESFKTFEEYQAALALREHFEHHVETVNKILSSGKSEEEIEAAMTACGYEKHLDAPCQKSWCEERYGCVSVNLVGAQRFFEEHVLRELLQSEDTLLSEQEIRQCEEEGCTALPKEWLIEGSRKHDVFKWFLDLFDWLSWNQKKVCMEDLASEPVSGAFLREIYTWTLHVLRHRPLPESWQGSVLIEEFLQMTDLLDKKDAEELLGVFLRQQESVLDSPLKQEYPGNGQ